MKKAFNILRRIGGHPGNKGRRWKAFAHAFLMHWNISILGSNWIFRWKFPLQLKIRKGYHSLSAQVYFGLSEFEEMTFLLDRLNQGDYFVDVGANLGAYSLLAAGVCQAEVLAIEPWPANVAVLREQVEFNRLGVKVEILQAGASDQDGELLFQSDSSQNTFVVEANHDEATAVISVPVYRLDSILKRCPQYIKIDVEGHELRVLNGLGAYLDNPELEVIQCETLTDKNMDNLHLIWQLLVPKSFVPYRYDPDTRKLIEIKMGERENTLFVRGGRA